MNIALFGAKGRVGSAVVRLAKGHNLWQIDKDWSVNPLEKVDVAIDFALPCATEQVVDFCKAHHCPLVTGVTGRNSSQLQLIEELSEMVRVVAKDNFSQGIKLLNDICMYLCCSYNWDTEIVEIHHKNKIDTPSGTAKMLASTIAQSKGEFGKVTVHSLRVGSNFGGHVVVFGTSGESLTITHQAESVDVFAKGALECAVQIGKN